MEPPMGRMLAFMPVAAPVCSGGTLPTTRLAIEAKASPMPMPNSPATTAICHWASCQKVRNPQASVPRAAPVVARPFDDDAQRDRVPAIALDGVRTAR